MAESIAKGCAHMNASIPYFISSHSSKGYVSYYEDAFGSLKHTQLLTGWPSSAGKSLFEAALALADKQKLTVHTILHSLDNSVEGLIFPELSFGIYLSRPWDKVVLSGTGLSHTYQPVRQALEEAHRHFGAALPIHDRWESIYLGCIDFDAIDDLTEKTIRSLFSGKAGGEQGKNVFRFLGAATHLGSVDVVQKITQELPRRIFIKGRPGTGKSTMLKKIRAAANQAGWDTEEYRCAFDPNSADMVVIRKLGVCLFDSTAPHEHFPSRSGDEILDVYQAAVAPGTDEKYHQELAVVSAEYKAEIRQATAALHKAWTLWQELENGGAPWSEEAEAAAREELLERLL